MKSMIATSKYFLFKKNWENLKRFWAPELGCPNQHNGLPNGSFQDTSQQLLLNIAVFFDKLVNVLIDWEFLQGTSQQSFMIEYYKTTNSRSSVRLPWKGNSLEKYIEVSLTLFKLELAIPSSFLVPTGVPIACKRLISNWFSATDWSAFANSCMNAMESSGCAVTIFFFWSP